MKLKLTLALVVLIPTIAMAQIKVMCEVPIEKLGRSHDMPVDEGVGEHAFKYVTGQEASKAAPRATYGGNMGSAQGQPTPSLGTGFK